jgi:hypothetical protein
LLYELELFCNHLQWLSGFPSLLPSEIGRLMLLLAAVEASLVVLVALVASPLWLVVQG